jgi:hypothetical protein
MIRPLRQRHRRIFAALVVILPAAFALGIAARKPVPVVETLPAALAPEVVRFHETIWSREGLFDKARIRTVLLRENLNSGRFAVQLFAPATFVKPDLLVYWSASSAEEKNKIPDDAVLLGAFSASGPLQLPSAQSSMHGMLILYSLADGEVLDVSQPISLQ